MLFDINQLFYIIRIILAGLCGAAIGLERKNRSKEAGIRTHFVVSCASALIMVISKYGFFDIPDLKAVDAARLAAQVVSGIGFLGAGMIFVHKNTVTGLTTAAGVWATSGVGLAIGSGMYAVGVAATLVIITAQILLHKNFKWLKSSKPKKLYIKNVTEPDYQNKMTQSLFRIGISVHDVCLEKYETGCDYIFMIEVPYDVTEEKIISVVNYSCSLSSGW